MTNKNKHLLPPKKRMETIHKVQNIVKLYFKNNPNYYKLLPYSDLWFYTRGMSGAARGPKIESKVIYSLGWKKVDNNLPYDALDKNVRRLEVKTNGSESGKIGIHEIRLNSKDKITKSVLPGADYFIVFLHFYSENKDECYLLTRKQMIEELILSGRASHGSIDKKSINWGKDLNNWNIDFSRGNDVYNRWQKYRADYYFNKLKLKVNWR